MAPKNICAQVEPAMHQDMVVACAKLGGVKFQQLLPHLFRTFVAWVAANPDARWDAERGTIGSDRPSPEERILHALAPENLPNEDEIDAEVDDEIDDDDDDAHGGGAPITFVRDSVDAAHSMGVPVGDVVEHAVRLLMRAHATRPQASLPDLVARLEAMIDRELGDQAPNEVTVGGE